MPKKNGERREKCSTFYLPIYFFGRLQGNRNPCENQKFCNKDWYSSAFIPDVVVGKLQQCQIVSWEEESCFETRTTYMNTRLTESLINKTKDVSKIWNKIYPWPWAHKWFFCTTNRILYTLFPDTRASLSDKVIPKCSCICMSTITGIP